MKNIMITRNPANNIETVTWEDAAGKIWEARRFNDPFIFHQEWFLKDEKLDYNVAKAIDEELVRMKLWEDREIIHG